MINENGGPAFPSETVMQTDKGFANQRGRTLRDYFAGQALMGMGTWSPSVSPVDESGVHMDSCQLEQARLRARAEFAVSQADALIEELNKGDDT